MMKQFGVAVSTDDMNAARGRRLHRYSRLLQRLQHGEQGGGTCGGGQLRTSVHGVRVAKCHGTRPAHAFVRMDSGEARTIACFSGVQNGGAIRPEVLFSALQSGLKRFREKVEGERVEAFAYTDDIPVSLCLKRVTANTDRANASLWRELDDIGLVTDSAKAVVLPTKGHDSTAQEINSLKASTFALPKKEGWWWWASRSAQSNTFWSERWG